MAHRSAMLVLPLIAAFFAGCVATDAGTVRDTSVPDAAAPPTFDDTTGAIQGVVTSDDGLPLGGATVGLVETSATTVTSVAGEFTLSNLDPGTYGLSVIALGYESTSRKVDVVAGGITEISLILMPIPVVEPYHLTLPEAGYVLCTISMSPGIPTTGAGGLPMWIGGFAACGEEEVPGFPKDRFLIHWPKLDEGVVEMLLEMEWTSTQAGGKGLSLAFETDNQPNVAGHEYGRAVGVSPLRVHVNATKMAEMAESTGNDCFESKCELMTRVFGSANTTEFYLPTEMPDLGPAGKPRNKVDAGVTIDQKNQQYLTIFFNGPRPDGFTALADQ